MGESAIKEQIESITYCDRVFKLLLEMPSGSYFDLQESVAPENREKFIEAVKLFMDYRYGEQFGFTIDFNSSFTRLQKFNILKIK